MRLAALEMIDQARQQGGFDQRVDLIFVTSLMSASDLRACLPAERRSVPLVLYMHENQAAYPKHDFDGSHRSDSRHPGDERDAHFALTNLASVIAADLVIWNSHWNRSSFLDGMSELLKHAPDLELGPWTELIQSKSIVIWPPVALPADLEVLHNQSELIESALPASDQRSKAARPIRVAWPHRWEHDKGPDELLRIAREQSGPLNLRWTILGERFRTVPEPLVMFQKEFAPRIDHFGFETDRRSYWRRLAACDWVLSTARHEFFGIAVVESLLAGCLPWLPDRLSYPELLPELAKGIQPGQGLTGPQTATLREQIARKLEPAIATNAVRLLDAALSKLVGRGGRIEPARGEPPA